MTKRELLGELIEKAVELDEDDILELIFYADRVAKDIKLDDTEAQIAGSTQDYERGDVYTLDEVNKGAGKE